MTSQNKYKISLQFEELPKETIKCMAINKDITNLVICVWTKIYIYKIDENFQIQILQVMQESDFLIDCTTFLNQYDFITAGYQIIIWKHYKIWSQKFKLEFKNRAKQIILNEKQNILIVSYEKSLKIFEINNDELDLVYFFQPYCSICCCNINEQGRVLTVGTSIQGFFVIQKQSRWQEAKQLKIERFVNQINYISENSFVVVTDDRDRLYTCIWNQWGKKNVRMGCYQIQNFKKWTRSVLQCLNSLVPIKSKKFLKLINIKNGNQFEIFEKFYLKIETSKAYISENKKLIIFWNSREKGVEFWALK